MPNSYASTDVLTSEPRFEETHRAREGDDLHITIHGNMDTHMRPSSMGMLLDPQYIVLAVSGPLAACLQVNDRLLFVSNMDLSAKDVSEA